MALNNGNTQQLRPTYYGYIDNTWDALVVVEAALGGGLTHIARRPHDREREHLIQSGSVFVYEENASGIKRWTDGLNWSPSRILGNFLIYRELETPFPPGEKKKATKKNLKSNSSRNGVSKASSDGGHQRSARVAGAIANAVGSQSPPPSEQERRLVGSLVDSYPFKKGGLLKKTISLNKGSVTHHVICYYSLEDVMHDMLLTPTSDPRLRSCIPRPELFENQSFRVALDHEGLFDVSQSPQFLHHHALMQHMYQPQPSPVADWHQPLATHTLATHTNTHSQHNHITRSLSLGHVPNQFQSGTQYQMPHPIHQTHQLPPPQHQLPPPSVMVGSNHYQMQQQAYSLPAPDGNQRRASTAAYDHLTGVEYGNMQQSPQHMAPSRASNDDSFTDMGGFVPQNDYRPQQQPQEDNGGSVLKYEPQADDNYASGSMMDQQTPDHQMVGEREEDNWDNGYSAAQFADNQPPPQHYRGPIMQRDESR